MIKTKKNRNNKTIVLLGMFLVFSASVYAEISQQPSIDNRMVQVELAQPSQENPADVESVAPVGSKGDEDVNTGNRGDAYLTDYQTCFTCT